MPRTPIRGRNPEMSAPPTPNSQLQIPNSYAPRAADLILTNARALTMDARRPRAEAVAVTGDRIVWVGSASDARSISGPNTRTIDCGGRTLLPGFHDAHIHLLAYAATLVSVDCRPSSVGSINELNGAISARAARTPHGQWIRAWGYDETALVERRHPTRWDLDAAAPRHPVRLDHGSGHATVLNSVALERVGIVSSTPEPDGATIARDVESGEPNGLLFEMDEYLDSRVPPLSGDELQTSVRQASRRLLERGVTSVQDATHHNSIERWSLFEDLRDSVQVMPRITLMPGHPSVHEFSESGLRFAGGDEWLRIGHAKLMVTASSATQSPSPPALRRIISRCAELGFPVAIHAVESEVVLDAARALAAVEAPGPGGVRNRIEHCSEAPPDVVDAVVRSRAAVVTQPGFVYHRGDRYRKTVDSSMLPWLYRARSLADRGVHIAFGSDAPVVDPDPMCGVYSALTRLTASGSALGDGEGIDLIDALRAYTTVPARLAGMGDSLGRLAPGHLADIIVFDADLESVGPDRLPGLRPTLTILGGRSVPGEFTVLNS